MRKLSREVKSLGQVTSQEVGEFPCIRTTLKAYQAQSPLSCQSLVAWCP